MKRFILLFLVFLGFASYGEARSLQSDINKATSIIYDFSNMPETSIPDSVLSNAKGLAILSVIKGGFIFSGRIGSGLVIARTGDGWSAPSAIGLGGAGWGLQIGGQITDLVLVLNTDAAVNAFASAASVTLGGNVSIAAGPVGRDIEAGISVPLAAVYAYSRTKGLFAGVSLQGTVIVERSGVNADYYGQSVSASELLYGQIPPPKGANGLYQALSGY